MFVSTYKPSILSVFTEIPVEIWGEIIDHILFDPILYLSDPFYPGCNPHTALNDWCDAERLLRLEFQRGILRLVSQPWKYLVDSSRWQSFQPDRSRDTNQKLWQSQTARRLEFYGTCSSCSGLWGTKGAQCHGCAACYDGTNHREPFPNFDNYTFKAEILRLPYWEQTLGFMRSNTGRLKIVFPHLRALFISVHTTLIGHILELVSSVTFLSLQLDSRRNRLAYRSPKEQSCHISLPVKTLQLLVSDDTDRDFFEEWDIPFLAHLEWRAVSFPQRSMIKFLIKFGKNLVTLHIHDQCDYLLVIPQDIWELLPVLEYFGATEILKMSTLEASLPPAPPSCHPLHTFALLEKETSVDRSILNALEIIETWTMLKTIADSHSWANVPQDLTDREVEVIDSDHQHCANPCWECILALHMACEERGLRYEDQCGRSFMEFHSCDPRVKSSGE